MSILNFTFSEFLNELNEGKEFLNEGILSSKLVNRLIRNASYSLFNNSNSISAATCPSVDEIAKEMGLDYEDNFADNKEILEIYEKVKKAYVKAQTAYLLTLNKELKSIK